MGDKWLHTKKAKHRIKEAPDNFTPPSEGDFKGYHQERFYKPTGKTAGGGALREGVNAQGETRWTSSSSIGISDDMPSDSLGGWMENCSAFTLFANLDDILTEKGIHSWQLGEFNTQYQGLREQGPDGVIGSESNLYGVLQLDHIAGSHGAFKAVGGSLYQKLVDVVYEHSKVGAAVTWAFMHPLKGVWQASLDSQVDLLKNNPGLLKSKRAVASEMTDDVRADAFYRGTENLGSMDQRGTMVNPVYAFSRAYQGIKNTLQRSKEKQMHKDAYARS